MTDSILIVDLETTGLLGEPKDHVVEIGIVELATCDLTPRPLYHAIVRPYYHLADNFEQAWVFQNTSLRPTDVLCGREVTEVRNEIQRILKGRAATSFNREFDFDRFLIRYPWECSPKLMPCIMKVAGREYGDELPCSQYPGCPSAQTTYSFLCPDNPANLPNGIEQHRALDDALMEAYILREMIMRGDYEVDLDE